MSINSEIISALAPVGLPCAPTPYVGEAAEYITFNYSSRGAGFADDEPGHEIYSVQVHYFCPLKQNSLAKQKQIKQCLFNAGGTWPSATDASDSDGQHYAFECEYVEGIDGG